jgi:hypothetical protein
MKNGASQNDSFAAMESAGRLIRSLGNGELLKQYAWNDASFPENCQKISWFLFSLQIRMLAQKDVQALFWVRSPQWGKIFFCEHPHLTILITTVWRNHSEYYGSTLRCASIIWQKHFELCSPICRVKLWYWSMLSRKLSIFIAFFQSLQKPLRT